MFRSRKKDILASAKRGRKNSGPASEPPTEPNTPPETPTSEAAASSAHHALSVPAVSLADHREMQLRARTQLRAVLTEVAREEQRTANLLAKFQQVAPSNPNPSPSPSPNPNPKPRLLTLTMAGGAVRAGVPGAGGRAAEAAARAGA